MRLRRVSGLIDRAQEPDDSTVILQPMEDSMEDDSAMKVLTNSIVTCVGSGLRKKETHSGEQRCKSLSGYRMLHLQIHPQW